MSKFAFLYWQYIERFFMTLFSERLKKARKEKGFLQKELAEILGISRVGYGYWETGTREPNFKKLVLLAKYLEVSTDYLLGVTDIKGDRKIMFSFFERGYGK